MGDALLSSLIPTITFTKKCVPPAQFRGSEFWRSLAKAVVAVEREAADDEDVPEDEYGSDQEFSDSG